MQVLINAAFSGVIEHALAQINAHQRLHKRPQHLPHQARAAAKIKRVGKALLMLLQPGFNQTRAAVFQPRQNRIKAGGKGIEHLFDIGLATLLRRRLALIGHQQMGGLCIGGIVALPLLQHGDGRGRITQRMPGLGQHDARGCFIRVRDDAAMIEVARFVIALLFQQQGREQIEGIRQAGSSCAAL